MDRQKHMPMNSIHAQNKDYLRFGTGENTFDRRLILRPIAKVGRIYPINLMTNIVVVARAPEGRYIGRGMMKKRAESDYENGEVQRR